MKDLNIKIIVAQFFILRRAPFVFLKAAWLVRGTLAQECHYY
jgi:hypothetical protein